MTGKGLEKWVLITLFLLGCITANAQVKKSTLRKHLIYFKDKHNSPFFISNPGSYLSPRAVARRQKQGIKITKRDLPVNPDYVAQLKANGAEVLYKSKWFNGAVVYTDSSTLTKLVKLPFVKNGQTLSRQMVNRPAGEAQPRLNNPVSPSRLTLDRQTYGAAFNQANMIGAIDMHAAGYRGEGMHVAVFDGGFPGVDQITPFNHLFQENRIKATYDFVGRDNYVFERDNHGTNVLSTMAGFQPGLFVGTAYKANYYLFITEDSQGEHQIEEINWALAAEFADSAGVDIINSSLGYTDFDFPSVDYRYEDLNGRNALITRAADYAAGTGMLVVNSAGNEGAQPWRYMSAPADGDSVLAVGATDSLGNRVVFSSIGPTADGRIKPDLAAQGLFSAIVTKSGTVARANGTSFSGPILCGLAVGFWQANRNLSNLEVIQYLKRSGSQAGKPDNLLGFGIPDFNRAQELVTEEKKRTIIYPNPPQGNILHLKVGEEFSNEVLTFAVYNMSAQQVFSSNFTLKPESQHVELDISLLEAGIYNCTITGKSKTEKIKFLKVN